MCESLFVHNFDLFLYKARRARVTVENRVETDVLYTRAFDLFALIFFPLHMPFSTYKM